MQIYYRSGYKYQLTQDFLIQTSVKPNGDIYERYIYLSEDGLLTIANGYAWDGPSGPTIDTEATMRGALVHDALYQLMRREQLSLDYRDQADKELRRICLEDGMWRFRAWYFYRAVRRMALHAASPENRKKVHRAGRRE